MRGFFDYQNRNGRSISATIMKICTGQHQEFDVGKGA